MTPSLDLFIFSDALGWDLAEKRRFLADLLPHRSPCDTLFGYSCTCDPSILTGCLPSQHGHFSFFVYDPINSPFKWAHALAWMPEKIAGYHRLRNKLSQWFATLLGYTGYFRLYSTPFSRLPFLDYTEKRDIYLPGGINGGQEVIFSLWDRLGIPWVRSDWRAGDEANVAAMKSSIQEGVVRCAYLYTTGLDGIMHVHGTGGKAVDDAFRSLDERIRDLHATALQKYNTVRIHLFSDHGMTNTQKTSDMMIRFEELKFKYGMDYAAVWDSTMVRFWFLRLGVKEKVRAWLEKQTEGTILADDQLRKWNCFFPGGRYGETFYLLHPGTIFTPCYMARGRIPGMHGFSPEDTTSTASWLTNYPGEVPRRIDQIFHVMRTAGERVAAEFKSDS